MPQSSLHNDLLEAEAPVTVSDEVPSMPPMSGPGVGSAARRPMHRPRSHQALDAKASRPPPASTATLHASEPARTGPTSTDKEDEQPQAPMVARANPETRTRARAEPSSMTDSDPSHASAALPAIRVSLPDQESLQKQRERAMETNNDTDKLRWAVQVLKYVERMRMSGTELDDSAKAWIEEAITEIVQCASNPQPKPEALYARGDLLASGAFPTYVSKDLRSAFSDFERSARMGWAPSWFRIGSDYEMLGDIARARTAYNRGVHQQEVGCMYRMGMAKVLGQLEVPEDRLEGMSLLQAAADASTVDTPHPAYVYGLILAGELPSIPIPLEAFASPENPSPTRESLVPLARDYLKRAAYLNLAAAQSKCGWCFEHAQLGFPFDPLMSVQYYSAASQGGEPEADMALSKWFLCGAESCFDKNESLAWTFAERAAKHHLPTAEFAMGYYYEVGIGVTIDLDAARSWYSKAAAQGNQDAAQRLSALNMSQSEAFSRAQHQANMDERLYSAHQRARKVSDGSQQASGELARRRTMMMAEASAQRRRAPPPNTQRQDANGGGAQPAPSRQTPSAALQQKMHMPAQPPATARPQRGPQSFSDMGYQPKQEKDCVIC